MKNKLKPSLLGLLSLVVLAAGAASVRAQAPLRHDRILVARAGVVNFVAGAVEYNHEGETAWRALTDKDELKSGDVVKTGAGGRAEVLLNPGSYFRLGELSQFELADASLDDLRLKLNAGSAIVEATGYSKLDLAIRIETPQTRVVVVRTGIYRINVLASGVTEVAVWKGRALVGEKAEVVKGGRVVRVGAGGEVLAAKLDKKTRDGFDLWSRERGKELAKVNEMLRRESQETVSLLNAFDFNDNFYGGVWAFSRVRGCYTFLPYVPTWRSPYGHSYGSWYFNPRSCQQCPTSAGGGIVAGNGGYAGSGGGAGSGSGMNGGGGTGRTSPPPPSGNDGARPMPPPLARPMESRPMDPGRMREIPRSEGTPTLRDQ
jgi:hypothetical protein